MSSAVQGVLLTKSLVFSGVRERGREMVSGREEKSKRGAVWIFHREEEEKKKRRRRRGGGGGGRERVLEMFYFNK